MSYYSGNDFLTVKEVSHLLRLSELTLYKYIRNGKLEAVEFGGHYRIQKSSLDRFVSKHKVTRKETDEE